MTAGKEEAKQYTPDKSLLLVVSYDDDEGSLVRHLISPFSSREQRPNCFTHGYRHEWNSREYESELLLVDPFQVVLSNCKTSPGTHEYHDHTLDDDSVVKRVFDHVYEWRVCIRCNCPQDASLLFDIVVKEIDLELLSQFDILATVYTEKLGG